MRAAKLLPLHFAGGPHPRPSRSGVAFDTPDQVRAGAVETQIMLLAQKTNMIPEKRALLGRWIGQGARLA